MVETPERQAMGEDVYRKAGSAIHGEKICAKARKVIPKGVTPGSSEHRIQRVDLEKDAYAVIAKPLRWLAAPR